ncbi:nicotinate-nucleotide--dimethylbenzimidazole phosphoribosyltransferase [Streptomyces sp. NPDC056004]|uniref:nicotinate-nucleotide--dimethylbenzimidazole phosphoribosyltransferase n=1 Tax=Streptomyces sp. NPDC056004 TaxID=3345677 RepID=UPI0035E0135C
MSRTRTGDEDPSGLTEQVARLCSAVLPADPHSTRLSSVRQLTKARPAGSLGQLDELVDRVAGIRHEPSPAPLPAAVSVLAGDHGVAAVGTSSFRHGATAKVLGLILDGRAPVNILAARVCARVECMDFGLLKPVGEQRFKVGQGTRDIRYEDAMTRTQTLRAVANGAEYASQRLADVAMVGVGEIGVGNTTATAALTARLVGLDPSQVVGAGSGVDPATVVRKSGIVEQALRRVACLPDDSLELLAALGGYEIAGNVGVILAAAARRQVVVIDGSISSVAALLAVRLAPAVADHLVFAHLATEPAHQALLRELNQRPLLSLDMRLGMASGATLALGLVNAALAVAHLVPSARSVEMTEMARHR